MLKPVVVVEDPPEKGTLPCCGLSVKASVSKINAQSTLKVFSPLDLGQVCTKLSHQCRTGSSTPGIGMCPVPHDSVSAVHYQQGQAGMLRIGEGRSG